MQTAPVKILIESETKDHYVIVYYRNNIEGDEAYGSIGANVFVYDIYTDEQADRTMHMQELNVIHMNQTLSDYVGDRCYQLEYKTKAA